MQQQVQSKKYKIENTKCKKYEKWETIKEKTQQCKCDFAFEFDDVNFNWWNCEREFWILEQSQRETPIWMPIWIWIWWCEFELTNLRMWVLNTRLELRTLPNINATFSTIRNGKFEAKCHCTRSETDRYVQYKIHFKH